MNARPRVTAAAGIFLLVFFVASGVREARAQETRQPSLTPDAPTAAGPEKPAAPRPAKERMAVYVLLAWVWLSIGVLLGLLRLRVREADRVFRMGLERPAEKTPKNRVTDG